MERIVNAGADKEPAFWQKNLTDLLEYFKATPAGLTSGEARDRLRLFGANLFHPQRKYALLFQFLTKFTNPLVIILLLVSFVSALTGDAASFIIISFIVFMRVLQSGVIEGRLFFILDGLLSLWQPRCLLFL